MTHALRPIVIRPASTADARPLLGLLRDADLAIPGVVEHLGSFVVAERDGTITGAMGLELRGSAALLRSAVVAPEERGTGIGRQLYERVAALARERGITTLYLLTTTADGYWARFGFVKITRDDVPESVRESAEFAGACPASATVMSLALS